MIVWNLRSFDGHDRLCGYAHPHGYGYVDRHDIQVIRQKNDGGDRINVGWKS
jgi:hypothetical protein